MRIKEKQTTKRGETNKTKIFSKKMHALNVCVYMCGSVCVCSWGI